MHYHKVYPTVMSLSIRGFLMLTASSIRYAVSAFSTTASASAGSGHRQGIVFMTSRMTALSSPHRIHVRKLMDQSLENSPHSRPLYSGLLPEASVSAVPSITCVMLFMNTLYCNNSPSDRKNRHISRNASRSLPGSCALFLRYCD